MSDNVIELISNVTEFNDMSEFMKDEDLDVALGTIIKLVMNADVPPLKIPTLIVRLQAMSAKFSLQARYYTSFGKDPQRKNTYYTAADALDKLVSALKYMSRDSY